MIDLHRYAQTLALIIRPISADVKEKWNIPAYPGKIAHYGGGFLH